MTTGLPTSRLINVAWSISAAGANYANINSLLILGDSAVIDTVQRIRSYGTLAAVATDFGTTAPEYLAAAEFFGQSPTPTQLYIGAWARTATHGALNGAALTTAQQALTNFTAVSSGGFKITVDGGAQVNVASINLSAATSLSNVASLISTALTSASVAATCTWNGSQFVFTSNSTGTSSSVAFLAAPTAGTNLAPTLGGLSTSGGYTVTGIAAETPLAAVTTCDQMPISWYALAFAAATQPADSDYEAVGAYIEATPHLFGIATAEAGAITSGATSDVGYAIQQLGYKRTFGFYSSTSAYAQVGALGDLLTTNLSGSNTMPTLMWKPIVGVTAESLTTSQADTLDGKRYNYYAVFDNQASIIVNGTCFGDAYVDEIFGLDWLSNQIQTDLFNLFTSQPKVAQTDAGMTLIKGVIEKALGKGVTNGLIGKGLTWEIGGFGSLNTGDVLPRGFYVYIPPLSSQSAADRKKRITPPIQVAITLAGAVHSVNATLTIQR